MILEPALVATQLLVHLFAAGVEGRIDLVGTATRGDITPEELQDLMAGGQELAQLEGSLEGTV